MYEFNNVNKDGDVFFMYSHITCGDERIIPDTVPEGAAVSGEQLERFRSSLRNFVANQRAPEGIFKGIKKDDDKGESAKDVRTGEQPSDGVVLAGGEGAGEGERGSPVR
jgi:hypothetical protein